MRVGMMLIGMLVSTATNAQVRMAIQPPAAQATTLNVARNLLLADPQIVQLKQEVAEIKQHQGEQQAKIVALEAKNAKLTACVAQLKKKFKEQEETPDPLSADSTGVAVETHSPYGDDLFACE